MKKFTLMRFSEVVGLMEGVREEALNIMFMRKIIVLRKKKRVIFEPMNFGER